METVKAKVSVLTKKEREAFCSLEQVLNEVRRFEATWIPVNTTGLSRLMDYRRNITEARKIFFDSVVDRFPNHTDFEFSKCFTDIVAFHKVEEIPSLNTE